MKKISLFWLLYLITFSLFSQNRHLSVVNNKTGKTKTFLIHDRVKVHCNCGIKGKAKGRLEFIDNQAIRVGDREIPLVEIRKIKKNPVGKSVARTLGYAAAAGGAAAYPYITMSKGRDGALASFLSIIMGSALFGSIQLIEGQHKYTKWSYEIVGDSL